MCVGIPPVLVQVQMDDWHLRIEPVTKIQIIVTRGGAKVGVAQVEAHSHMARFFRSQVAQACEEFVELLRRVMRRVFDRELQSRFCRPSNQRQDRLHENCQTFLVKEVDVQQYGAEVASQIEILPQQGIGIGQAADWPATVRGPTAACRG